MTVSYLPMLINAERDLVVAQDGIKAYRTLCMQHEWAGRNVSAAQTRAFNQVKRHVLAAARQLDVSPTERAYFRKQVETLRDENEGLRATVARQRDTIERLNAAMRQGV
jgi:hypothetical protein